MRARRIKILGVPVDCINMSRSLEIVDEMIAGDQPESVIAVNPEKVIKAQNDPQLMRQLHRAGLLIPDGIGVVLAARLLGLGIMERVPGSELMPAICGLAAHRGYRVFLFGANTEVNRRTREVLRVQYPGIQIVGNQDGFMPEEETPALLERINASRAQILFIALGSPKQELWMEKYLPQLNVRICQGVGGTFDVLAGNVRRAPAVFRKVHMEWFYRLLTNPRRLLRQTALPKFVYRVISLKIRG
jgi:N-acetylglucosaminyldiphosphoundecaprenol N-acetyl-beta-D-mannosaminyltransferase